MSLSGPAFNHSLGFGHKKAIPQDGFLQIQLHLFVLTELAQCRNLCGHNGQL